MQVRGCLQQVCALLEQRQSQCRQQGEGNFSTEEERIASKAWEVVSEHWSNAVSRRSVPLAQTMEDPALAQPLEQTSEQITEVARRPALAQNMEVAEVARQFRQVMDLEVKVLRGSLKKNQSDLAETALELASRREEALLWHVRHMWGRSRSQPTATTSLHATPANAGAMLVRLAFGLR